MNDHGKEDVACCHIDEAEEETEGERRDEMGDDKADTAIDYVVGNVDEGESEAGSNDGGEVAHAPEFEGRDEHASKDEFFKDGSTKNDGSKEENEIPGVDEMSGCQNKTSIRRNDRQPYSSEEDPEDQREEHRQG